MEERDDIKTWAAGNYRMQVCGYLMMMKVAFVFSEEVGLEFMAPESFVKGMRRSLRNSYGCERIEISEVK